LTFEGRPIVCARQKFKFSKDFTMKTFGSFYRLAGLCASSALASAIALAAPQTGSAQVRQVHGTVMLDSSTAKAGDVARPGSTISTGTDSKAVLYLGVNGPDVSVMANSRLSIDELSFDDAGAETVISTKLGLSEGRVDGRVKATSSQSSYVVTTPHTTAAIRGTVYSVTADGKVYVWEGCVDVVYQDPATSRSSTFNVCAGQMFDPSIPGVVDIPPGVERPFPPSATPPTAPVGPYPILSPVKSSSTSAPISEG
jgi:hypothetical protein